MKHQIIVHVLRFSFSKFRILLIENAASSHLTSVVFMCIHIVAFAVLVTCASGYRQISDSFVVVVQKISYLPTSGEGHCPRLSTSIHLCFFLPVLTS
jgi:hypothetical protein